MLHLGVIWLFVKVFRRNGCREWARASAKAEIGRRLLNQSGRSPRAFSTLQDRSDGARRPISAWKRLCNPELDSFRPHVEQGFPLPTRVSPILVVIADEFSHEPFQVAFVEDDHMVEQVTPASADETFGDAVLPRTLKAGSLGLDTEALQSINDFAIEIRSTVENQKTGRRVERKRLAQLLDYPVACWVAGHIEV